MGRMAIVAVVCWLSLSQAHGEPASGAAVLDNVSEASAPRLYRNVPLGVYASAAPYAAYSFHLPQFIAAPRPAASQLAPVQQKPVNQIQTYLMDSYGNKFAETPQLAPYKAAFPQQFVALQPKLPEHLAQPLVAASPNFQFKQSAPQVFFGAPYRLPALQSPAPTPLNHFPTFGQLYGEKVQSLAPTSHSHGFGAPSAQQQSSNNKAVFANTHSHEQYNNNKNEPTSQRQQQLPQIIVGKPKLQNVQEVSHGPQSDAKFQRIQEAPHSNYGESKFQRIQEAPHTTRATIQSGAKFQRIQEAPNPTHGEVKFQRIQEKPHTEHNEAKFQQQQDKPHASHEHTKFQRLQDKPHSSYEYHEEPKFQPFQEYPYSSHEQGNFQPIQEIPQVPHGETKFQRLQESPKSVHVEHKYHRQQEDANSHATNKDKAQLQAPTKETTITYVSDNGKTSVVKVKTKPLPLLDLTLLEPLKFDNPLVPQVQHFLPRINQATYQKLPEFNANGGVKNYQKEFMIQKTMSYDSRENPQESPKKKQKKPTQPVKHAKKNDVPKKTVTYHHETLDDAPEIVYEISNSPGHKETIKEKAISYNKETQSEPVHYSYGSKSEKEPVTYSYTRSSKEPLQIQEVHYHGNGPSHLIYNFKPEEQHREEHVHSAAPQNDNENHKGSSEETENQDSGYHRGQAEHYEEHPKSSAEPHEHTNKEQQHYHQPEKQHESLHASPPKYYAPAQNNEQHFDFEPMTKEFEEDIRLLASAQIKVDPNQHVNHEQHVKPAQQQAPPAQHDEQPHEQHRHQHSSQQQHPQPSPGPQTYHHYSAPHTDPRNAPAAHIQEKSKRIIIQEEAPDERHTLREQMKEEIINHEPENSEEDFEKAYKDAAFGFPAYSKEALEAAEKDIFDPDSYGVPPDHVEYNIDHTPFEQYQEEGDDFPKKSRASYKDSRDKMKEDYYTDYSISKPESLLDRYQNKLDYYKLYKQQKPDYLVSDAEEDDKKKEKQKFAKYSVAPSFNFASAKEEKSKSYYGHHKPKQQLYEYDYSKAAPRDNSAFASRPYQRYKSKTNFVEPQFQYGFEPIAIPKLLDSELAAMASNHNPESEKPGMRKKVYKENWYIKKTSTASGAPAS